jgi:hypothetical protein
MAAVLLPETAGTISLGETYRQNRHRDGSGVAVVTALLPKDQGLFALPPYSREIKL